MEVQYVDTEIIRNGDSVKIYSLTVRDYSFTVREPTKAEKLIERGLGKLSTWPTAPNNAGKILMTYHAQASMIVIFLKYLVLNKAVRW